MTVSETAKARPTTIPISDPVPVQSKGSRFTGAAANYIDERTSISGLVRELGRKVFPDHWSFMLGEVALYSFVVILLSGTFLTFFFQPSMAEVVYNGSYVPLKGMTMSAAYASSLDISFDIRGGLLFRQIHHWAALLFIAAIGLHMLRVYFTGAFRKPRELNWFIGFVLFILAMAEGFTGYSLPDDLLSGNGLRIIGGMIQGIPVIGTWLTYLIFGGSFPGTTFVALFYSVHILLVPAIIVAALGAHLLLMIINKHTQFAGPGRTNDNVVGVPVMPIFAAKAGGFFFVVFGVIVLIGSMFTINPIWTYGPYDPSPVSAGTQPDWYIGFADGMLRIVPPGWEFVWLNHTWSFNIISVVLILPIFLGLVAFYPFIEGWITGDKREHHIAERPRNAPTRTAIGAAGISFYAILWAAASSDLMATHFKISLEDVIRSCQLLVFVGPVIAYLITKRVCLGLQKKDREIALHGFESGRIVRMPGGEFIEVHEQLSDYERWRLVSFNDYTPLELRPNADGKITAATKARAALSHWFFEARIAPVTKTDLEKQNSDHH